MFRKLNDFSYGLSGQSFFGKSGLNLPFPKMNGKYLFKVNNKNATIMSAGTVLVSPLLRD